MPWGLFDGRETRRTRATDGEPERSQRPGEARALPGSNSSGSTKGYGFHGGFKPSKRRSEAGEVLERSARADRSDGNIRWIPVEEKSSEGRSPRVPEAEIGFQEFRG
jgi:hypothetical protein